MVRKPTRKCRDRMLRVADVIEKRPKRQQCWINEDKSALRIFNMGLWFRHGSCETPCCLAGYAAEDAGIFEQVVRDNWGIAEFETFLSEYFGLDTSRANDLCTVQGASYYALDRITGRQAASVLRWLADTGEVDWPRYLGETGIMKETG